MPLPSVLWHCWLGSRKGIWPVKNWMLAFWWWWSDWSCACVRLLVCTTISSISCCIKIQNGLLFWYRLGGGGRYWRQWADERFGDPPPRWIREPLMVRDKDGRPQEWVHCFCLCSGSVLLVKGGYYVAGPPLLNGRCTSLLRAPRLRNDLYCASGTLNPSIQYHTQVVVECKSFTEAVWLHAWMGTWRRNRWKWDWIFIASDWERSNGNRKQ